MWLGRRQLLMCRAHSKFPAANHETNRSPGLQVGGISFPSWLPPQPHSADHFPPSGQKIKKKKAKNRRRKRALTPVSLLYQMTQSLCLQLVIKEAFVRSWGRADLGNQPPGSHAASAEQGVGGGRPSRASPPPQHLLPAPKM